MIAPSRKRLTDEELLIHLPLSRRVAKEHLADPRWRSKARRAGYDELVAIGNAAIVEARETYNENARPDSTFAGFALFVLRRHVRRRLCHKWEYGRLDDINAPAPEASRADELLACLNAEQEALVRSYYGIGAPRQSSRELADRLSVSRGTVTRRLRACLDLLRREL